MSKLFPRQQCELEDMVDQQGLAELETKVHG